MMRPNTYEIADLLNTVLTTEQVAGIIDALLSCEADERLDDRQVEIGQSLFNRLCDANCAAVSVAQGSWCQSERGIQ